MLGTVGELTFSYGHTSVDQPSKDLHTSALCIHQRQSFVYSYTDACINHNEKIIKTSDTVLRKIYLSLYLKGCV